jgi:hypothetical protein
VTNAEVMKTQKLEGEEMKDRKRAGPDAERTIWEDQMQVTSKKPGVQMPNTFT